MDQIIFQYRGKSFKMFFFPPITWLVLQFYRTNKNSKTGAFFFFFFGVFAKCECAGYCDADAVDAAFTALHFNSCMLYD